MDYQKAFEVAMFRASGGVGFCERCGFVVMDYHGWRDMENRLCFECAEYDSEPEITPSSSGDEVDSDVDDPDWIPPVWLVKELEEEIGNQSQEDLDTDKDYNTEEEELAQ